MLKRIFFIMVIGLVTAGAIGQDLTYPPLKGYKVKTDYPVYTPENLWDFIDGAADSYLAYGFTDLHVAEYKKGKAVIKLEIYKHSDHTMAFGIYSSERSPSFKFMNLGSQGYNVDGATNFFKGNYYVKIRTYSKKAKVLQAEESLATRVAGMLEGETTFPGTLSLFPSEGRKTNEETYINESALGHSFLNRFFKVPYQVGSDDFSIFVSECSTAEEANRTANTFIASTGISPVETADSKFILTDGYNGTIFISWKDKTIVLISGLAKDQAELADRYTSEILRQD